GAGCGCGLRPEVVAWGTAGSFSGALVTLNQRVTTLLAAKYGWLSSQVGLSLLLLRELEDRPGPRLLPAQSIEPLAIGGTRVAFLLLDGEFTRGALGGAFVSAVRCCVGQ